MPWNALSFKRVKWYHMHAHCRTLLLSHISFVMSLHESLLLVEFEYVDNVVDHEIYKYIEVLLMFRVLDSIDELYFYYCCL